MRTSSDRSQQDQSPLPESEFTELASELTARVPEESRPQVQFVEHVRKRITERRRRRRASVALCIMSFTVVGLMQWMRFSNDVRPTVEVAGTTPSQSEMRPPPGGELPENATVDDDTEQRWVTLSATDLQKLSQGHEVPLLKHFTGRPVAIVPVLERNGESVELSWKATALDQSQPLQGVMTDLDQKLLQRQLRVLPVQRSGELPGIPEIVL